MDAVEFLNEWERACRFFKERCINCDLSLADEDGVLCECYSLQKLNKEELVDRVAKFSQSHPRKTILSDLLERLPFIPLDENGLPKSVCPEDLGYKNCNACENIEEITDETCRRCWCKCIED